VNDLGDPQQRSSWALQTAVDANTAVLAVRPRA
jgi:hypothetical protein